MTLIVPAWAQTEKYTAEHDRLVLRALEAPGVYHRAHIKVTNRLAGSNMSVDIAAGQIAIPGPNNTLYVCTSTAVENRPVGAAPASGTSRIDLVIARVYDPFSQGSGSTVKWDIEVIPGTPSATSPVAPVNPSSSLPLAEVRVAAGDVSIAPAAVTDLRARAANPGAAPMLTSIALANSQKSSTTETTWGDEARLDCSGPIVAQVQLRGYWGSIQNSNMGGVIRPQMSYDDGLTWTSHLPVLGNSQNAADRQMIGMVFYGIGVVRNALRARVLISTDTPGGGFQIRFANGSLQIMAQPTTYEEVGLANTVT